MVANIAAARQARCQKLAQIVVRPSAGDFLPEDHGPGQEPLLRGAKIESAVLSPGIRRDQPGRYARIVLRLPHSRVAVTGIVAQSDARNVDSFFSAALLWFHRLQSRPKRPCIEKLIMVVEHNIAEAARQRHALLRDSLQRAIDLLEIDESWQELRPLRPFERKHLWRKRLARFPSIPEDETGERVRRIIAQAPHAVDVVRSRHGQTLRYHGLPFARRRRVWAKNRIWFGFAGRRRRMLARCYQRGWAQVVRCLGTYARESW